MLAYFSNLGRWLWFGVTVLAAAFAALCIPAKAAFYSGNDMLAKCQSGLGNADYAICLGYVEGVADSLDYGLFNMSGQPGCIPDGVTAGQLKDVLVKALNDDPANRNLSAFFLAKISFIAAWHCTFQAPKQKP